ncbi:MAG: TIGR02757 family protein [Bacteroidetes bacterium]|nr:TIGR02757 family protein [Bacteroidota bacterium]
MKSGIRQILEEAYKRSNHSGFVESDPVSIPHAFFQKQDIEIAGFFAAIMSWGNRTTIIRKANELINLMGNSPHDFVLNASSVDKSPVSSFVHRTLNGEDVLFLLDFLKRHYQENESLESAFVPEEFSTIEDALIQFNQSVFPVGLEKVRTRKHVSDPRTGSACKRLNMYLRWMVRCDDNGVDFGIWKKIKPRDLICPLDVHVHRVALEMEITKRKPADWKTAVEITDVLKSIDKEDPVRFDYALFTLGLEKKRNT